MRAYSTDLRERIVRVVAEGRPMREAARRFGVSVLAVRRYVARQQETGSLERKSIPGGPRKIRRERDAILLARLEAEPDATVLEHCAWWAEHQGQAVSEATMWRAMHRLGWTHKKALAASERDEAARAAWRAAVAQIDPKQLVFVDESGTHTSLTRLYGWAPHDQRATGSVPRNHGKNTTLVAALVAALTPNGLQAPWTIEGAMDTAAFERYVQEVLGPTLRPGQIVVLDNLSVHKAASIRQAIETRGCELRFLPPYSPDFTPIEQAFSKVKAILRGLGARVRDALVEAIRLGRRHHPRRCGRLVHQRGIRPACSGTLTVAVGMRIVASLRRLRHTCPHVRTLGSALLPAGTVETTRTAPVQALAQWSVARRSARSER